MDENPQKLMKIKSMESSNLFQRRLHHDNHNYDFIGDSHEDVQLRNHKSNTNTLKIGDNNDNSTKLNNSKAHAPGGGEKMASMGKSVKFEITKGSVDSQMQ